LALRTALISFRPWREHPLEPTTREESERE
jgi:hypothetical protein